MSETSVTGGTGRVGSGWSLPRLLATIRDSFGATKDYPAKYDTERAQAIVRLVLTLTVISYFLISMAFGQVSSFKATILLAYFTAFAVWSILLFLAIVRWPGVYPWRRILTMLNDYAGLTFSLVVGGEPALPVYAIVLWVTVGNGLRYGARYLRAATCFALATLAITTVMTPFWLEQPYMVITLVVTAIIVPAYAHLLLGNTRKASEAAVAANRDKSRLLAQASHDLRQPVHAISLFTACLKGSALDPEQKQLVVNIDRSLHSVAQLFRSLLDISTLDSGRVSPRFKDIALGELLEEIVRNNSVAVRWADGQIDLVPTTLWVRCDPDLLKTMVQNLVSNAMKYAVGQPVLVGCRRRNGKVVIEVHDRGRGISENQLTRIFEEFYRVRQERDRDIEGVGLGLSIVKRLADMMDLSVGVASRPGIGSVFSIAGVQIVKPDRTTLTVGIRRGARVLDGLKVLLVEDDEKVLLATAQLLEKWGCVVQSESGVPAAQTACDLIITDFDLGNQFDGGDCIAQVRAKAGRDIPALVMTGHDASRVREALPEGVAILSKPFRPAELRSAMVAQRLDSGIPQSMNP